MGPPSDRHAQTGGAKEPPRALPERVRADWHVDVTSRVWAAGPTAAPGAPYAHPPTMQKSAPGWCQPPYSTTSERENSPPPPDGCAQAGPFFSSPPKGPPLPGSLTCPGPRPHRRILGFFLAASSDTPTRPRLRGGGADCVPPFWQHALTPPAPMGRRRPSSWDARRANRLDIGVGRPGRPPRRVLLSVVGVWGGGGSGGDAAAARCAHHTELVCAASPLSR